MDCNASALCAARNQAELKLAQQYIQINETTLSRKWLGWVKRRELEALMAIEHEVCEKDVYAKMIESTYQV